MNNAPGGLLARDIESVLLTEEQIKKRVRELADQLMHEYEGKEVYFVGILNGAVAFYVDLIMEMDLYLDMYFMRVSSYGSGTQTSGSLRIEYDLEADIAGKHVVIIEDIIDSGRTLKNLTKMLLDRGPASVKSCCLLDKPERREVEMEADYVGFKVPDVFLVGYGLDYAGKYRNLNYIGTLKSEVYSK